FYPISDYGITRWTDRGERRICRGLRVVAGHNEATMFILAHQFRGVSSENNRPDTYPAELAQASRVQSVKHLVCKCHHTTERRLGYSSRHIGLEASALPKHTV